MIMGWEALVVAGVIGWAFGYDAGKKSITKQVSALARVFLRGK